MKYKFLYFIVASTILTCNAMQKDEEPETEIVLKDQEQNKDIDSYENELLNKFKNIDLKNYRAAFQSFNITEKQFIQFCKEHELDHSKILKDFKGRAAIFKICTLIKENSPETLVTYYKVLEDKLYKSELFDRPEFFFDFCSLIAVSPGSSKKRLYLREFLRDKAVAYFKNKEINLKDSNAIAEQVNNIFTQERLSDVTNAKGSWNNISLQQIYFLGILLLVGQSNSYVGKIAKHIMFPSNRFDILNYISRGCLDPKLISILVCVGYDINKPNEFNQGNALTYTSFTGNVKAVLELLLNGANVNYKDVHGNTALKLSINPRYADSPSNEIIQRLLITFGANGIH